MYKATSGASPDLPLSQAQREFSDLTECLASVGTYGKVTVATIVNGSATLVHEDNYDGQLVFSSSTTAVSGMGVRLGNFNIMPKAGDSARVWFKMPATIDANTTICVGFIGGTNQLHTSAAGAQIIGNVYRGYSVIASSPTTDAVSVTMTPSSRYCVEVKYSSTTQAVVNLYDSAGALLNTANVTTTQAQRVSSIIAWNSGTVAKELVTVDALEYKLSPRTARLPL